MTSHRPGNPFLPSTVAAHWWDLGDALNELIEVTFGPKARLFAEKHLTSETRQEPKRSAAYEMSFDVARIAGPMKMAEDLDLVGLPLEQLAEKAAEDYQEWARGDAKQGTLDGFQAYIERGDKQVEAL